MQIRYSTLVDVHIFVDGSATTEIYTLSLHDALPISSLLKQQAYVNGQWIDALNGETNPVLNPATGEQIATVPDLGAEETQAAIAAADLAFKRWEKENG